MRALIWLSKWHSAKSSIPVRLSLRPSFLRAHACPFAGWVRFANTSQPPYSEIIFSVHQIISSRQNDLIASIYCIAINDQKTIQNGYNLVIYYIYCGAFSTNRKHLMKPGNGVLCARQVISALWWQMTKLLTPFALHETAISMFRFLLATPKMTVFRSETLPKLAANIPPRGSGDDAGSHL